MILNITKIENPIEPGPIDNIIIKSSYIDALGKVVIKERAFVNLDPSSFTYM